MNMKVIPIRQNNIITENNNIEVKGMIFGLQRFSVHDGPGVRTIVFLKGCPLRCPWCSNPESQEFTKQLASNVKKCIKCNECVIVCDLDAISFIPDLTIDYDKCNLCGKCVEVCYPEALELIGKLVTVDDVMNELEKDANHYRRSNGGITLSGGEALAQPKFITELLRRCQKRGWHTAIETAAWVPLENFQMVLPYTNLILIDIKHMDTQKHKEIIGRDNQQILDNAKFIAQYHGVDLTIRVPVIPNFNDRKEDILAIAKFAETLPKVTDIHLLPYHKMGDTKYDFLQYENLLKEVRTPSVSQISLLKQVVESNTSLHCQIGG